MTFQTKDVLPATDCVRASIIKKILSAEEFQHQRISVQFVSAKANYYLHPVVFATIATYKEKMQKNLYKNKSLKKNKIKHTASTAKISSTCKVKIIVETVYQQNTVSTPNLLLNSARSVKQIKSKSTLTKCALTVEISYVIVLHQNKPATGKLQTFTKQFCARSATKHRNHNSEGSKTEITKSVHIAMKEYNAYDIEIQSE